MRIRTYILAGFGAAALAAASVVGLHTASAAPTPDQGPSNIIGGRPATETYSFMVSLQRNGSHGCGGALIKANWVATAAHCVSGGTSGMTVRIGTTTWRSGGTTASVSRAVSAPGGDFALIQLSTSVSQRPVPIPAESGPVGTRTRIIGWGQTCPQQGCGGAPANLQELDTSIVADSSCQGIRAASEICTDNPNRNSGACYGDSGGPQVKGSSGNWQLVGTTSRAGNNSSTCATAPSIYNDVPSFRSWIISVAGPLDTTPTASPTASPTRSPTASPTASPTSSPTSSPTGGPGCGSLAAWSASKAYVPGNQVSHNGSKYESTWYSTGAEPGAAGSWAVWKNIGAC